MTTRYMLNFWLVCTAFSLGVAVYATAAGLLLGKSEAWGIALQFALCLAAGVICRGNIHHLAATLSGDDNG